MEDVIRKIRKLLALSGSPNPNEAAAAATKARKLFFEHNLSMDALGVAPEEVREEVFATGARSVIRGTLIFAGAKLHLCALLYGGQAGRNGSWILVGRPGNIEAARVLIQYLLDAMDRCTKLAATGRGLAWANDYRRGWVSEMRSRLVGSGLGSTAPRTTPSAASCSGVRSVPSLQSTREKRSEPLPVATSIEPYG